MLSSFWNLDVMIVVGYLLLTLYIGIKSSKKITTFKEYAIGDGTFTTPVLTATLLATIIGTEDLIALSQEVFSTGILWILLFLGNAFNCIIVANFIASHIHQFKGAFSASEIIGVVYGRNSRIISAISGTLLSIGYMGAQIVAIGYVFQEFLAIDAYIGIVAAASVLVLYSTTGGINSVTKTDVIQFIFLIVAVPIVSYFVFSKAGGVEGITRLMEVSKYDSHFSIVSEKYSVWAVVSLFILFYIPGLSPVIIQRLLMADGDIKKTVQSMRATALTSIPFYCMVGLIGFSAIILFPNIQADLVFPTIIKNLLPTGVKGLAVAGLLAVAMSTADSYLNVAAVLITNDIIKPLKPNISDNKLFKIIKFITFILGIIAIIIAIYFKNIMDIILTFASFWSAMVTIPLFVGILGIRASGKTFVRAAVTGAAISIVWLVFPLEDMTGFPSFGPAIVANVIVFFTSRYFERAQYPNEKIMIEKQISTPFFTTGFPRTFPEFANIVRNSVSENAQYVTFGVFIIATYIVPIFMWSQIESPGQEYGVSIYLRILAGIMCSLMILSDKGKEKFANYLPFYWLFTICFCLPFSTTFMFLENHGSPMWLVNMTISVFLLSTITNWVSFVLLNAIGITAGYYFYIYIYGAENLMNFTYHELYMMIYIVAFSSLVGFIFTRNKEYIQQRFRSILQKQVDEKTIEIREKNIRLEEYALNLEHALTVKQRFLNNISHEIRTPLQNLYGRTSSVLNIWDKLDEERKVKELKVISENNEGLFKYVSGILDIAAYEAGDKKIAKIEQANIQEIMTEMLRKISEKLLEKKIQIVEKIDNITIEGVDKEKLTQALCHILDNAVKYSEQGGVIEIKTVREKENIIISIKDEGVGVPNGEEEKIFEAFEESSRTRTRAEGKGLGLTLSRAIIAKHGGKIWCKSNVEKGSIFSISLPRIGKKNIKEIAVDKDKKQSQNSKSNDKGSVNLSQKHVIVVDDSRNVLGSFELILMGIGCEYKLFDNGPDALEYVRNNEVDVILTDYMMEPMNGIEFAREVRRFNTDVPIILQSGVVSEGDYQEKMREIGINAFLPKPHNKETVTAAIINVLK